MVFFLLNCITNQNVAKIQILKSWLDVLPKPVSLQKDIGQIISVRTVTAKGTLQNCKFKTTEIYLTYSSKENKLFYTVFFLMCLFILGCFAKVIANEKTHGEGKSNNHLSVKVSYWDQRAHVTLINYSVPRTGFISLCLSLVIR